MADIETRSGRVDQVRYTTGPNPEVWVKVSRAEGWEAEFPLPAVVYFDGTAGSAAEAISRFDQTYTKPFAVLTLDLADPPSVVRADFSFQPQ